MSALARQLRHLLAEAGYIFERQGKGDHEIWRHPISRIAVVVDGGMTARHTANGVLKQARLPKFF